MAKKSHALASWLVLFAGPGLAYGALQYPTSSATSGGTPDAHASSHQNGGSDEVATATPGANAIPKASSGGKLDSWITTASTSAPGIVQLATSGEVSAEAVLGTDTRLDVSEWNGLKVQSPLDAKSDYFSDSSLAGAWTEGDPASNTTFSEGAYRLKATHTSSGSAAFAWLAKTVPADTQVAITIKVALTGRLANYTGVGVFLGEDVIGSPTTASFVTCYLQVQVDGGGNGDADVEFESWSKYDTFSTSHFKAEDTVTTSMYLRAWYDTSANTYRCLQSATGLEWTSLGGAVAQASTQITGDPVDMGVFISATTSTDSGIGYIQMFRVDATSDPFLPVGDWQ